MTKPGLVLHVARLTEADQVAAGVSLCGRSKLAERPFMVDGQGFPDVPVAIETSAVLLSHYRSADNKPSLAPIGSDATAPIWSAFARFMGSFVFGMTSLRAKAVAGLALVLSLKPRLQLELATTATADNRPALDCIEDAGALWRECICRSPARAPLVADFVVIRHRPGTHVPFAATGKATEAGLLGAIRFHLKRLRAYLASLCNHGANIANRIEEAQRQADLFVPQDWQQRDSLKSYELALEEIRKP